jgi:hypothetical protein
VLCVLYTSVRTRGLYKIKTATNNEIEELKFDATVVDVSDLIEGESKEGVQI